MEAECLKQGTNRILEIGLSYNPGGVESFVMNYYRQLVKKGIQFDFVCMYPSLAYEDEIRKLGGKIYYTVNVKKHIRKFRQQLQEILAQGSYETVHINMLSAANIVPLQVACRMHVPTIIAHSHNTQAPGILRNFLHRKNRRAVMRYATDYWACSQGAAEWLYGMAAAEQAVIIRNAVCVQKYLYRENVRTATRAALKIPEDTLVLGHIGRFEEQKNHRYLLEIFAEVVRRRPDSILLLVGDGMLHDAVSRQAEQLHLTDRIRFLGRRSDVPELLGAMDVFVFPSLYEGLSVTAIEAQCAGLPCIASSALAEETAVMENFLRIPLEKSPGFWADAIVRAAKNLRNESDNDRIYQRMSQAGFEIETEADRMYTMLTGQNTGGTCRKK